jgi:hypothetical protein
VAALAALDVFARFGEALSRLGQMCTRPTSFISSAV